MTPDQPAPSCRSADLGDPRTEPPVLFDARARVAYLTLNRPQQYNGLNAVMVRSLREAVSRIASSDDVRVVVIRGAGKGFCGGGDIGYVASHFPQVQPVIRAFLDDYHALLAQLRAMPQVVLTSVHGAAAGAGLSLAAAGDLCIAADTARFVPAYAKLGVSPDCGGSALLVEALGLKRAMRLLLCETQVSAAQADTWGLVSSVVSEATLGQDTMRLAERLAGLPHCAVAQTKALLYSAPRADLGTQLNRELEALLRCTDTAAYRDAVARFLGSVQP